MLSIPTIYRLSIDSFAPFFNEYVDVLLFNRAVTALYIAHIVVALMLTVPKFSLEDRLRGSLLYGFLVFAAFIIVIPDAGLIVFPETPMTWAPMTWVVLTFLSLAVLTGSVVVGHKVDEILETTLKKIQVREKSKEVKIGERSYLVEMDGRKLIKKCFKGLGSDAFEDVVGGVTNWILLRDASGVPKLTRFDLESMCIFVEHVEGKNLREFITERGGRLDEDEAACIALEVAKVLREVWESRRVVHRDLKPENIIIAKGGGVWVIDWEYSIKEGAEPKVWIGTLPYAPRDLVVSSSYDVYSLGIVLQEAIIGSSSPRASLTLKNRELKNLIEGMRKEEPRDRVSIGNVVEALGKICGSPKKKK